MNTENEIAYWDCDDCPERLYYEDIDEAIENHLDSIDKENQPEVLEVYGYKRGVVDSARFQEYILEAASEYLSERHDGEDGHEQNKEIEEAASLFVKTYLENYTPWGCELIKTEKINTKEWILKNRPDWTN